MRRWSFAGCVFDEASWMLVVDGERVSLESKPLELLRELLARGGSVASKAELLDAIWPEVTVVEGSLPTAVYKLRLALRDDRRERCIIETVAGLGYRLGVPVSVEDLAGPEPSGLPVPPAAGTATGTGRPLRFAAAGAALGSLALILAFVPPGKRSPARPAVSISQRDAGNALRRLDVPAIEAMLAAGWSPNTPFDKEGNGAVNYLLNMCEWDPGHDRRKLLLMVRTLYDGGAKLDHRNVWGDTAYSIAKADRYCGPEHPVTRMLRTQCFEGFKPLGDRCLASYEIARRGRAPGPARAQRAARPAG